MKSYSSMMLGLVVTLGLAQVDTVWFRHHQYSPSYSYQFMRPAKTLVVDAEGASYVCAYGQFGTSSYDFIVLKYSGNGKLIWETSYEAGGTEVAYAMAVDEQGAVYVTGQTSTSSSSSQVLTVKWKPDGTLAWARKVSGTGTSYYNFGYAIAVYSGAVYVAGQLTSSLSGPDMALLKLDAGTGEVKWTRTISASSSGSRYEAAYDIRVSPTGAIFIAGRTFGSVSSSFNATFARYDTEGNKLWQQNFNSGSEVEEVVNRICLVGDLVVGTGYVLRGSNQDVLTLAYRSDGQFQWKQEYNGPGSSADRGNDIAADPCGDIVLCGLASGGAGPDALVLKYRQDGALLWAKLYDSGLGTDEAMALDIDAWGGVVVATQVTPGPTPAPPFTVVKFSVDGNLAWQFLLNSTAESGPNSAQDVVLTRDAVIAAGITTWPYPNYSDPSVFKLVEVPDVGIENLLTPTLPPNPGEVVTPRATVRNYSTLPANLSCQLDIADGYSSERPVSLAPNEQKTVVFEDWTPGAHGNWRWECYTRLGLDYNRTNDTVRQLVYVNGPAVDAGVTVLIEPHSNIPAQSSVTPRARFRNFGTAVVDVWAFLSINLGGTCLYRDSVPIVGLEPNGSDTMIQFRGWVARQPGFLTARCSTWTEADQYVCNDTLSLSFAVLNEPIGRWTRLPDVPLGSSNEVVYTGGGLAVDDQALYVLKGYQTRELHIYSLGTQRWTTVESVPLGAAGRPVYKGGALVADGLGRVHVVKGNKTFEFWRFDPVVGWTAAADIPEGPKGKAPKGGTGLAYAVVNDTGYVYLLKGSGRAEFYRYNTIRDTWDSLPEAPAGASGKAKYGDGSALAFDGISTIYCLKGKYNEVFAFDVAIGQWRPGQLPDVPLAGADGRQRKVKHGGDITWAKGKLGVLKGGNTCQFWVLEPADSTWYEYPPVPQASEDPKRIKAGGGLEFAAGRYYALKGNKTRELWRFDPAIVHDDDIGQHLKRGTMVSTNQSAGNLAFLSLSPSSAFGRLHFNRPLSNPATLTVFDAIGRVGVKTVVAAGRCSAFLDLRQLAAGVYFLTVEEGNQRLEQKLVIVR
ncbi:MAG: PQQ-binding-like beta-propeller repeat protein [candidate division WOR-3 bacterium]